MVGPVSIRQLEKQGCFLQQRSRGSAVPFSEALLRSAERVTMDGHPGLARSRTAQRNGRNTVHASAWTRPVRGAGGTQDPPASASR